MLLVLLKGCRFMPVACGWLATRAAWTNAGEDRFSKVVGSKRGCVAQHLARFQLLELIASDFQLLALPRFFSASKAF